MQSNSRRCYCAFCKSERTIYRKKHISLLDVVLAALGSGLITMGIWQDFDPRGLYFFAIGLIVTEACVILRWRVSINCSKCGFDPVLYKKDPEAAARKVKSYMEERQNDPLWVLTAPKLQPIIKKKDASGSRLNTKV